MSHQLHKVAANSASKPTDSTNLSKWIYIVLIRVALASAARITGPMPRWFLKSLKTSNSATSENSEIAAACRCGLIEMEMPMVDRAVIKRILPLQARKVKMANNGANLPGLLPGVSESVD